MEYEPTQASMAEQGASDSADRLELALRNYAEDRMTLGQAAELAGISQPAFMQQLGKRRIPMHYGMDDLKQDIAAAREISQALSSREGGAHRA